jgi:hypothetical protein
MTQTDPTTPHTQPVSAVTKHIKIYSDNPIHDAIDRVIDRVLDLDDPYNAAYNASQLVKEVEKLHRLACNLAAIEITKYHEKLRDAKKTNKE